MGDFVSFREVVERFASDAVYRDVVQRLCAERQVKVDARPVPVETPPFQPPAAAFYCDGGERFQNGLAVSLLFAFQLALLDRNGLAGIGAVSSPCWNSVTYPVL